MSAGLWRLQKLYQAFSDRIVDGRKEKFLIDAIRIPDVGNCREILRKLDRNYDFNTKRIVVDLYSIQDYDKFMSQVWYCLPDDVLIKTSGTTIFVI